MEKKKTHEAHICLLHIPFLQQGSTPKTWAQDSSSPSWLQQSHPTTSATVLMMTGTPHNEPPTHLCNSGKQLASSFTHPQSPHLHPFLHQELVPATVPPPLPIFSSFLPLSLGGIHGEAPIASLPPGIQASLHPLCVTTTVHRNCQTEALSSHKFCRSSWLSQVAGFTWVSEKDVWASQAGNYRMTSPC